MRRRAPTNRQWATVVAVGVGAGVLSGLFGIGGGLLIVPGLMAFAGMGQKDAQGTSLAAIVPIVLSALVAFAVEDSVDWPVAAALAAGASAGAVVGTHALHVLPLRVVRAAFVAVMLVSAVRLLVDDGDATGRAELDVALVVAAVAVGAVAGTLAGLLGVGGAVVMIPAMVLVFGIPAAVAKGTSLAVMVPTAVVGTRQNARHGHADLRVAAAVGAAGVLSAYAASKVSVGLDEGLSNALFAALLAVIAAWMVLRPGGRTVTTGRRSGSGGTRWTGRTGA